MQRCNPHVIVRGYNEIILEVKEEHYIAQNIYVDVVIRRLEDILYFWGRNR